MISLAEMLGPRLRGHLALRRSRLGALGVLLLAFAPLVALAQSTIPRTGWSIAFVDSQEMKSGYWGPATPATSAIDGNASTFWHTEWYSVQRPFPHEIRIDLGTMYSITGFRHLPRQDGNLSGRIANFEFYVSADGSNWGSAVASGTLENIAAESTVAAAAKFGRYVRLRALSGYDAYGFAASLAELNVLTDNLAPNGAIDSPTETVTITEGESVTFAGTGTDPDSHTPLTYAWTFGANSGVPDSAARNPGAVQFNTPGTYSVRLTVTDALGQADPSPATRTVVVESSTPTHLVPRSGWSIAFVDSQETRSGYWGPATPATSAIDGNPATFWHSEWYSVQRALPHEIRIDLGVAYHITGFRHLPRQDGNVSGRIGQFEFYVSADGTNWGSPIASGTLPNTGTESSIPATGKFGRFVRLRALSTHDAYGFATSLAEINFLTDNRAPDGSISAPAGNVTISTGQTVNFSGNGTDPDADEPLSYSWDFGAGSGVPHSSAQNPGAVQFNVPGTFTVTLTVTDPHGQSDPTPATRTILVESSTPTYVVPRAGWSIVFVDSQETRSGSWGPATPATSAIDGNANTFWHTEWYSVQRPFPHEIQIDLGLSYHITGFRHLPRQDGNVAGRIAQFEFYVSADGANWGSAVAAGNLANTSAESTVPSAPKQGRYVRFRALSNYDAYAFAASLAEFNLLTDNRAPDGAIVTPAANVTIAAGDSVTFSGSGSDPDDHTPLAFAWNFGAGSGVAGSTAQNPGARQFNLPGTYTVTMTVTDSTGQVDPTPVTRTITVESNTPSYPVPRAGWSIAYVDSQEMRSGSWGPATPAISAIDGNASTFWHTEWHDVQRPFPHEIQIDLGVSYHLTGFRLLPRQDGNIAGRIAHFEFYVSADGLNWGSPVATGAFSNTALESTIPCAPKSGRYVRLRALSNYDAYAFAASIAELNFVTDNRVPESTIVSPAADVTISPGETVTFSGSGSDADGHTPLSFAWSFGTGSGIPNSTAQNPGAVAFNTPGTYIVRLSTTDSLGQTDPSPATRTITVVNEGPTVIPRTGWTVAFVDSHEPTTVSFVGNGIGSRAIDGNIYSIWHTQFRSSQPPPPHEIRINLGAVRNVAGFRYLPSQDANQNIRIAEFEFYVSTDGTNWGSPVATGHFPNTQAETEILFPPKSGQFVRLRALNNQHGSLFTAVAELNVLQANPSPNNAPNGTIDHPGSAATIPAGAVVDFGGLGSDPDGGLLTYRWTFGLGSGIPDSRLQNPGLVRFTKAGTYTVSLFVADPKGLVDSTPATRVITVEGAEPLSRAGWSLHYTDSEELTGGSWGPPTPATSAFDGNSSTFWHTEWFSTVAPLPHELQINLGATHNLGGFSYLPRQDNVATGRITNFEFYLSTDGVNWGSPVAAGVFSTSNALQQITFLQRSARYIRLRALGEVNGNPATAVAELGALLAPTTTPSVRLVTPHSRHLQTSSTLHVLADANVLPNQGVRFVLDGSTIVDDFTAPYEAAFNGLSGDNHNVDVYVVTAEGDVLQGFAHHDRAEKIAIGDYLVALGDSITYGFGDDIVSDNVSADGRNATSGFTPMLSDYLSAERGRPVVVYNEGLGGENSAQAAVRVWSVVQKHPDAQQFLIMYGSNDAFVSRPSGLGLNPGDAGYAGSFKDYMQQILDVVIAAGKTPFLARVPPTLPLNGANNLRVQSYNQVIAELVADPSNNIGAPPPDFYGYFAPRTSTHFIPDNIHPNGLGYQGMATLWFDTLE